MSRRPAGSYSPAVGSPIVDKAAVIALLKRQGGDGHTIFAPDVFLRGGFSERFVFENTRTFESDGSLKGTIWKDGEAQPKVTGVYQLALLESLLAVLDLPYPTAMGRGSRARQATASILAYLESK